MHYSGNNGIGWKIVERARTLVPDAEVEQLLQLNFGLEESQELAHVEIVLAPGHLVPSRILTWQLDSGGNRIAFVMKSYFLVC